MWATVWWLVPVGRVVLPSCGVVVYLLLCSSDHLGVRAASSRLEGAMIFSFCFILNQGYGNQTTT